MIIESIVTTVDPWGEANFAPMGVEWGEQAIVLKPFVDTQTFRNIAATGAAVVNLTDDVMVFAQAAIVSPQYPTKPARKVRGVVMEDACSWREVEVSAVDATPPRAQIPMRVVHHGTVREFLGFNRARHAVLEAAILATRVHILPRSEVEAEYAKLQIIVNKTAGPRESDAMALLTEYVQMKYASVSPTERAPS